MRNSNKKTTAIVLVIVLAFVGIIAYYKMTKTRLVNKENYMSFREQLLAKSKDFKSNSDLQKFIIIRLLLLMLMHLLLSMKYQHPRQMEAA